jgi:hypothetical protein
VSEKVFRRKAYANVLSKSLSRLLIFSAIIFSLSMYLKKVEKNVDDNGFVVSLIGCFLYSSAMSSSRAFVPAIGKFPHDSTLVVGWIEHCLNKNSEMYSEPFIPSINIEAGNIYLPSRNVSVI